MDITAKQADAILRTLPVSLYLGTGAPVKLSEDAETSRVNTITREIEVSFRNVAAALAPLPAGTNWREAEAAVREELYHEIGHLILSPTAEEMLISNEYNILEDERMETRLAGVFANCDFVRSKVVLNGWRPGLPKPTDFEAFFFRLVRFREDCGVPGAREILPKIADMIRDFPGPCHGFIAEQLASRYWEIVKAARLAWARDTSQTPEEAGRKAAAAAKARGEDEEDQVRAARNAARRAARARGEGARQIAGAGIKAANAAKREAAKPAPADAAEKPEAAGKEAADANAGTAGEKPEAGIANGTAGTPDGGEETTANANADADATGTPTNAAGGEEATAAAVEAVRNATRTETPPPVDEIREAAKLAIGAMLESAVDPEIEQGIMQITGRACRKRAMHSGARHDFYGRPDPRAILTRTDFRWCMRQGGGEAHGDRINLRLWVDCSGSFSGDDREVNKLISSLLAAERAMPDRLKIHVIGMNHYGENVRDKRHGVHAAGGNRFGARNEQGEITTIVADKATKLPNWRTVNLVVWDGNNGTYRSDYLEYLDADRRAEIERDARAAYAVLNNRDTVIVTDPDNEETIRNYAPLARTTVVHGCYADNFVREAVRLLDTVL